MRTANMPDQGDPARGIEERFAAAVELGRPSGLPADDDLARDLEIAAMLRALGPALDPGADARARVRATVFGMRAPAQHAPVEQPTERLPVVPSGDPAVHTEALGIVAAAGAVAAPNVPDGARSGADDSTDGRDAADATAVVERGAERPSPGGPGTAVLAEPDLTNAVRPRRRRRHALPSRPDGRPGGSSPSIRRRIMAVGAAALVAVLAVTGGGIFASRDAVPGDPLYAIKRAAEAASGIFTSGEASKGRRDLDLAATRLGEIERMVRSGAPDTTLLQSALRDFDDATSAGSRLALSGADPDHSAADLSRWSTQQTVRLSALRDELPAAVAPNADDALRLLDRVHRRATALAARSSCATTTSGAVDDIGPLPATGPCTRRATGGTAGSTPADAGARATPAASEPASDPGSAEQRNGGSDSGLLPEVSVGGSGNDDGASAAPTTSATPPSGKSVDVPLPQLPITVPPLGKSLLG